MSLGEYCDGCKFFVDGECKDKEAVDLENCYIASDVIALGKDSELVKKGDKDG